MRQFINSNKKSVRPFLLTAAFIFAALSMQAQTRSISGTVTSEKGDPMIGVTISLKGTELATTTDANGKYSLAISGENQTLVFSYVNYKTQEIQVKRDNTVNVTLQARDASLSEVVVIGYGTVKKTDLTGSVVSIKAKDLTPGANMSVEQTLEGRVSGVQIYQKSGEPGSAMSIKIRGASSLTAGDDPLYVIDGMPINNLVPVSGNGANFPNNQNPRNPLNSLNPADIESIEVLKDASATAIYGSRGSNGVVIITTKKGSKGKLKIGYNVYVGQQKAANSLKLLTGDQYKSVLNQIIDDGGGKVNGVTTTPVTNNVVNTNWQEQLYQTAIIQNHDLSLSGGKDNTRFYASLGYYDQPGVLKNSGTTRYSARINVDNSVAKKYGFGFNIFSTYIRDKYNSVGVGVNENGSALYSAINYDPSSPIYDSAGNIYRSPAMGTTLDQPLALINGQYAYSDAYRTNGTVYGEYFFVPELSVKVRIGGDVNSSQRNTWIDPSTIYGQGVGGVASINTGNINYYMAEGTLNYNKEFGGKHKLTGVLGSTYEHFGSNTFGGSAQGFSLPDLTFNAIGTGNSTLNQIGSGRASTKIISYLGRINYSFKDKYLITASARADGSSRFAPKYRYGYFPSVAIGWKINEESFLKDVHFINELKFRASYGAIGNQAIANYLYIASFSGGADAIFGGSRNTSLAPSGVANPDLKWEAAKQADMGIDFSLFDRRINGTIEYYDRRTSDLLLALPLPLSTGFSTKTQNIGSMKNTGFDISINAEVVRGKYFNWNILSNISTVKNVVLSLGPLQQIFTGGAGFLSGTDIIKPGLSLGTYYGYKVIGVWQTNDDFHKAPAGVHPGDLKFLDVDGNNQINANDRVVLGKSLPDFTYGFTSTFEYKGITLSVFFEGAQGGSVLNNALVDSYFPVDFKRNKLAKPYLNRWTPTNPTNEYPSFVNYASQGQPTVNSKTVENASYLRCQSLRLGYNFKLHNKIINGLQLYATGQNLFTITKYSGIDPAINAIGNDIIKIDYSTYPLARTFLVGLNVQF